MRPRHILLAVLVSIIWGCNFIFIQFALQTFPPFLLCTLRFFCSSLPLLCFFKRPTVTWAQLFAYGFLTFFLQFIFLFWGMSLGGMPPGLTAIVIQTQMLFSLLFAMIVLKERPGFFELLGAAIALLGISVVCAQFSHGVSWMGFLLILGAAASWGGSNIVSKKITNGHHALALVAWGGFIVIVPLICLTLMTEGLEQVLFSFQHLSLQAILALFYIVCLSTWFGYGAWMYLLRLYTVSAVVPFGLLVPVFGMLGAMLVFDEPLQPWKILVGFCILFGLFLNVFGLRIYTYFQKKLS